jgi:hypothetical protein
MEEVNSTMIYFKNFCKFQNVPLVQYNKKEKSNFKLHINVIIVYNFSYSVLLLVMVANLLWA